MTDPITADFGIRQLHARFADAVFRKDADAFAACFALAGEWKIAGMHIRGREEIRDKFDTLLAPCARVQILTGTPVLEFNSDGVSGRLQMTELAKMGDGSSALTLGVYFDRYVEEDGRWRFAWRHFGLHYRGPVDLSAELVPCPDFGPPPGMPAPEEPTLTRRKA
jgi:uncharacterized protein (TIGR02246 family)